MMAFAASRAAAREIAPHEPSGTRRLWPAKAILDEIRLARERTGSAPGVRATPSPRCVVIEDEDVFLACRALEALDPALCELHGADPVCGPAADPPKLRLLASQVAYRVIQ